MKGAPAYLSALLVLAVACGSDGERVAKECPDCFVQLQYVATIGEGTGEGALTEQSLPLGRDARGRFIAMSHVEALPILYDDTGAYLGRLGSEGEGPGQFLDTEAAFVRHDSLFVLDARQGRLQVFDEELEPVRSILGIAPFFLAVPLGDGRFVTNNLAPGRLPMTLYGPEGREIVSFGGSATDEEPRYAHLHRPRVLATSSSGGIWSLRSFMEPRAREWSPEGELLRDLPLELSWYEPYTSYRDPSPALRPAPILTGAWEDADGRLWIVGVGADEGWAEGLGEARAGEGGVPLYPIEDPHGYYDTFVSVVDPELGGAVVRQRRLEAAYMSPDPWLLMKPKRDELGFQSFSAYRVFAAE